MESSMISEIQEKASQKASTLLQNHPDFKEAKVKKTTKVTFPGSPKPTQDISETSFSANWQFAGEQSEDTAFSTIIKVEFDYHAYGLDKDFEKVVDALAAIIVDEVLAKAKSNQ